MINPTIMSRIVQVGAVIIAQILMLAAFGQYGSQVNVKDSDNHHAQRDYPRARQHAWTAAKLDNYNGYAQFYIGTNEFLLDRYKQAIEAFSHGMPYMPHLPNILRLLGQCY